MSIPWDKLDIPDMARAMIEPGAPRSMRLAAARGTLPATPEATLGMLYALACDEDKEVHETAVKSLKELPNAGNAINQRTHPKVLELLANVRPDRELDERIMLVRNANERTAALIASRADEKLCEMIAENHERLLLTPQVIVALHQNPKCNEAPLERAIAFLRMQHSLPELPASRPQKGDAPRPPPVVAPPRPASPPADAPFDLEAEILAALEGKASPMLQARQKLEMFDLDKMVRGGDLGAFSFDFKDESDFSLDMLEDGGGEGSEDERLSVEKRVAAMSVGQKLKLAYLGNKTVRSLLIRDRNKMVSSAVVKSGRLTDAEVLAHAGNRNLHDDVLREIANNREWTRKYPVKVALVNNPKCPPSVAVSLVSHLQMKDLASLARNRNVSSVVFQLAAKMQKQKGPA